MKIFISYRHSPAIAATASLLHDRLSAHLGAGQVFLDSDQLALGDHFPDQLNQQLSQCRVFIALVDPHWLATVDRLRQPQDWVCRELTVALRRRADDGIRVLPLLLQGAAMPGAGLLPPALAVFSALKAMPLHSETLDDDIAQLTQRVLYPTRGDILLYLQARCRAAQLTALALLLLLCASTTALFDLLTLDTRLESLTVAWADAWVDPVPHPQLRSVVIDADTQAALRGKLGEFGPGWRSEHARLVHTLARAGATAVAFDLHMDAPSAQDTALAGAVAEARRLGTHVVFGQPRPRGAPVLPPGTADYGLLCIGQELSWARTATLAAWRPVAGDDAAGLAPPRTAQAQPTAYTPATPLSADGVLPTGGARTLLRMALGAVALAPGAQWLQVDTEQHQLLGQGAQGDPLRLPFARIETVLHDGGCHGLARGDQVALGLLRYTALDRLRDPSRRARYEAVVDLPAAEAAARYRGRIVLVGTEFGDDVLQVIRGLRTESRYGHEVHADVINTLAAGVDLQPLELQGQATLMVGMGLLGLVARFWQRLSRPLWRRLYTMAVPVLFLVLSTWLCAEFHVLVNSTYAVAAFFFAQAIGHALLRRRGLLQPVRA